MGSKRGKPDFGAIIGKLFANIDVEALIMNAAPAMLPGMLGNVPMLQQMGVTPQMLQAALTAPPPVLEKEDERVDVPRGGAFRLALDWPMLTDKGVRAALHRILTDPQFQDVAEDIADAVYLAHGMNLTIDHDPSALDVKP